MGAKGLFAQTDPYGSFAGLDSQLAEFPLPMADGSIYIVTGEGILFGLAFETIPTLKLAVQRGVGFVYLDGKGVIRKKDGTKLFEQQ